ncbi:unnamed protein product [Polarella glacialis]|uniref:Uncharacterized protein n=1 Tax=Polarella glacialis TaxID=89957 RepID=A0A813L083_POLGL|nr:unnamed protein product [Polarella glacialis]
MKPSEETILSCVAALAGYIIHDYSSTASCLTTSWTFFVPTHAFKPHTPEASVTTRARKEDMLGIRNARLALSDRLGKAIRSWMITMQTGKLHSSEKEEKKHVVFI